MLQVLFRLHSTMKIAPKTQDTIERQSTVTAVFSLLSVRMTEPLQSGCNKYTVGFTVYFRHSSDHLRPVICLSLNRPNLTSIYITKAKIGSALCQKNVFMKALNGLVMRLSKMFPSVNIAFSLLVHSSNVAAFLIIHPFHCHCPFLMVYVPFIKLRDFFYYLLQSDLHPLLVFSLPAPLF